MWNEIKLRSKSDHADVDFFPSSPKDWSFGRLVSLVSFLLVFMCGIVLGLSGSAHYTRYFASRTELFFPTTIYSTECYKDSTGFKTFSQPTNLAHTMSDDELFWRASLVPKMEDYPFQRVPKVAFMFMTRGPLPFAPLWERLFKGHKGLFSIYVHALPDYRLSVPETSVFFGRQIPSEVRSYQILFNSITSFNQTSVFTSLSTCRRHHGDPSH